jgi:hypothetical protein
MEEKPQPKTIPIWQLKQNENTSRDLNRFSVEEFLRDLEGAQKYPKYPVALDEVKVWLGAFESGIWRIENSNKKDPKHRKELERLFIQSLELIEKIAQETGFDLRDRATWS